MRSVARTPENGNTRVGHCIDGVITAVAEREHAISGEWIICDYCADAAQQAPTMMPRPVSDDGIRIDRKETGTGISSTRYRYFVNSPHADDVADPRHNVNSPAGARL